MDPEAVDVNPLTPVGPVPAAEGEITPPAVLAEPEAPAEAAPHTHTDPEDRPAAPPPAKPVPLDPTNPVALAQFDSDTWDLVLEQQGKIKSALAEFQTLNEEAKAAKKVWEARVEELSKLIDERQEQRGKPVQKTLLDFVRPAEVDVTLVPGVSSDEAADPHEHLWREVSLGKLTDLGCRPKDIQVLTDGVMKNGGNNRPLMTMGDLTDFTGNVGMPAGWENRITDFRGVGPGVATRIGDAASAFWAWWNGPGKAEYITERGLDRVEPEAEADAGRGGPAGGDGGEGDVGEPAGPAAGTDGDAADPFSVAAQSAILDSLQSDEVDEDPAVVAELGLDAGTTDDAEVQPPDGGGDIFPLA